MRYREIPPPAGLAGCLQSLWELSGRAPAGPGRILPDGCMDVVIHPGHAAHAVGPLVHPLEVPLSGEVHAIGACVRPGAARALLGLPADAVADAAVPLRDLLGPPAEALAEAVAGVLPRRALTRLALALQALAAGRPPDAACVEAARRLRAAPGLAIPALAAALGLSARQLERRFRAHVGLPPKVYARVARFDRAVRRLGEGVALAELAQDCGYADQAHFGHEFRAFAGMSPRVYVANRQDAAAAPP